MSFDQAFGEWKATRTRPSQVHLAACAVCYVRIERSENWKSAKFCSVECRKARQREQGREFQEQQARKVIDAKPCSYCETIFVPNKNSTAFCSDTCRTAKAIDHKLNRRQKVQAVSLHQETMVSLRQILAVNKVSITPLSDDDLRLIRRTSLVLEAHIKKVKEAKKRA